MFARSLLTEHYKGSNLLEIVTWPALEKQNQQAKKVHYDRRYEVSR